MKHFINRKTVQNNELLPSASYLQDWITQEVDTGNVFVSNGTVITKAQGADRTETLKNKQIGVTENNLTNTKGIIDDPYLSDLEVKGGMVPSTTIPNSFYGILDGGVSLYNPNAVVTSALNQSFNAAICEFRTADPSGKMGFVSLQPYFSREMGFEIKATIKSVSRRCFFGFSDSQTLDLINSSCVFIGFDETTTKFTVFSSNGVLPKQTEFATMNKDVLEHTAEIILKSDSIVCRLDSAQEIIVTSRIPALTDQLYLHCYGIV